MNLIACEIKNSFVKSMITKNDDLLKVLILMTVLV